MVLFRFPDFTNERYRHLLILGSWLHNKDVIISFPIGCSLFSSFYCVNFLVNSFLHLNEDILPIYIYIYVCIYVYICIHIYSHFKRTMISRPCHLYTENPHTLRKFFCWMSRRLQMWRDPCGFAIGSSAQWRYMGVTASEITSNLTVCLKACPSCNQRKYESSTSPVFVTGIHRLAVPS